MREENIGDSGLYVEFYVRDPEPDPLASKDAGYEVYSEKEWIKIVIDPRSIIDRPVKEEDKDRFYEQYRRFHAKASSQVIGIPLTKAPFLPKPRAVMYERNDIYTVEQLAESTDNRLESLGMGTKDDREKAKKYLAERRLKDPVDNLQKKNAELEARLKLLEEENSKLAVAQIKTANKKSKEEGVSL